MKGMNYYYRTADRDGKSIFDRIDEQGQEKIRRDDETFLKMMAEQEWTVRDVPETFQHLGERKRREMQKVARKASAPIKKGDLGRRPTVPSKGPDTITARRAATALSNPTIKPKSLPGKPLTAKPRPALLSRKPVTIAKQNTAGLVRHSGSVVASKSTIDY